ncbi:hypothetical protein EF405_13765 [Cyclobacteriaceae bacterium YHN15]|nr:hypothetical protein EF405_13765 [Cyclobacteriaceae bacterium YHN15]
MDENEPSIAEILFKNTGLTLDDWISMIKILNLDNQEKIIKYLTENEGLTYRTARFIALRAMMIQKRSGNHFE